MPETLALTTHPASYDEAFRLEAHLVDAHFVRPHGEWSLEKLIEIHELKHAHGGGRPHEHEVQ